MEKHTKQIAAFLMILAVVSVAGCTEKMSAEQIAARMTAQEDSIKDFSAVGVTTVSVDGNNTTTREKIIKKADKRRDEFIEPATSAGKVVVKNGSTEWTYYPANNQATKRTLRESELSEMDYIRLIKGIMDAVDISYEGIENAGGRSAYAILVTPHHIKTDRRKYVSNVRVWIDCKNWMLLKLELHGVEDGCNVTATFEYTNITFNTGIPDSEFIFEAPEGVRGISKDGEPDTTPTAPASDVVIGSAGYAIFTNWDYMSYQNLSISNAPALNQTARLTYSIIPNRDMEILFVQVSIPDDGFELMDIDDTWPHTRYTWVHSDTNNARWYPTNLSKDTLYQFNATIKAVKTGNWTIVASGGKIYLSVSKDSAYLSDEPFPKPPSVTYFLDESELNESEIEKALANILIDSKYSGITVYRSSHVPANATTTPSKYNITRPTPCPTSCSFDMNLAGLRYYWNGTAWVERNNQS